MEHGCWILGGLGTWGRRWHRPALLGTKQKTSASSEALVGVFTCSAVVLMVMIMEMGAALMLRKSVSFSRLYLQKLNEHDLGFCTGICRRPWEQSLAVFNE